MLLGEGGPHEWRGKRGALPLKGVILPLLTRLTWKWLQINTDILLSITSTGDELLRNVNINDLEWPFTLKIVGLVNFYDFGLRHTFQEWIAPKWLEIDQDNLHMEFSALNVDFISLSPDPLDLRRPANAGAKEGYPSKKWLFIRCLLVERFFAAKLGCDEMDGDRPKLPANRNCYRLLRVSWALTQIFCWKRLTWMD